MAKGKDLEKNTGIIFASGCVFFGNRSIKLKENCNLKGCGCNCNCSGLSCQLAEFQEWTFFPGTQVTEPPTACDFSTENHRIAFGSVVLLPGETSARPLSPPGGLPAKRSFMSQRFQDSQPAGFFAWSELQKIKPKSAMLSP